MTPKRLQECLTIIRWGPATLSQALHDNTHQVDDWMAGTRDIPTSIASWLEALCFTHEASELMKPRLNGDVGPALRVERPEHVPVYSYNLLRALARGPVSLSSLFGTDDEAAVFFLVSRGLAERIGGQLQTTEIGRRIGQVMAERPSINLLRA